MCKCRFKPLACGHHSHTDMSLDGAANVKNKIIFADKINRIADVVTDHGIMDAIAAHHSASKGLLKSGKISKPIKSIHGIEAYIIDPHRPVKVYKNGKEEPEYYHLTIHFRTFKAYEYFCKLTPTMYSRMKVIAGEEKHFMTFEELEKIAGNDIVISSGCLVGPVQKNVMRGRSDLARKMYIYLRELAGPDNFFVEVMPHPVTHNWKRPEYDKQFNVIEGKEGKWIPVTQKMDENAPDRPFQPDPCTGNLDLQKNTNYFVIKMAEEFGDPVVVSMDDHFAEPENKIIQDVKLGNGAERWKFYAEYGAYTSEQSYELFKKQFGNVFEPKQLEEWIDNSYRFVDRFNDYNFTTAKDRWLLPTIEMVYGKEEAKKTTRNIFWEKTKKYNRLPVEGDSKYKEYMERIEYELSVLCDNPKADFLPYFFVLEDACDYARKNDMLFCSRGSAAGCLVLYALGVTITDPIKHKLPFERMLTLGRINDGSLPDVDLDWPDRLQIFEYLQTKYGAKVALISTNMLLKLKSSILDAERALRGKVSSSTAWLAKRLKPEGKDIEWLFGGVDKQGNPIPGFWDNEKDPLSRELREYAEKNPDIWEAVKKCIGVTKNHGVHAGGVVITPGPSEYYMPVRYVEEKKDKKKTGKVLKAVAYDMNDVEYAGGIKYDFLGVSTLKGMAIALKSLREMEGIELEWKEWDHDPKVIDYIINKNHLATIFQIGTKTMKPVVKAIKPKNVTDYSTVSALYRPGALDAPSPDPSDPETKSAVDYFIDCAQGKRKPYYIHPDLEPILNYTHAVCVYQEQNLEIFRELADYTYETGEDVRRGIAKKKKEKLDHHLPILKKKLLGRGWTEDQADRLVDSIMASAKYQFNKGHSMSYAVVGYNQSVMKYYHPLHYWKGFLSIADTREKIDECLSECRSLILPIDIRKSHATEWTIEDGKLRPPMAVVKGCGDASAKWREVALASNNIEEFVENTKKFAEDKATKKQMSMGGFTRIVYSGAFDEFLTNHSINGYFEAYDLIKKTLKSTTQIPKIGKGEFIGLDTVTSEAKLEFWRWQSNALYSTTFLPFIEQKFLNWGYRKNSDPNHPLTYILEPTGQNVTTPPTYVTDKWTEFFKLYYRTKFFEEFKKGLRHLKLVGIITKAEPLTYKGGKERIAVSMYIGTELVENLVMWPDYKTGIIPLPKKNRLEVGEPGVLTVKPSVWNGRKSGAITSWEAMIL